VTERKKRRVAEPFGVKEYSDSQHARRLAERLFTTLSLLAKI
jgi:hypothetical protein